MVFSLSIIVGGLIIGSIGDGMYIGAYIAGMGSTLLTYNIIEKNV